MSPSLGRVGQWLGMLRRTPLWRRDLPLRLQIVSLYYKGTATVIAWSGIVWWILYLFKAVDVFEGGLTWGYWVEFFALQFVYFLLGLQIDRRSRIGLAGVILNFGVALYKLWTMPGIEDDADLVNSNYLWLAADGLALALTVSAWREFLPRWRKSAELPAVAVEESKSSGPRAGA